MQFGAKNTLRQPGAKDISSQGLDRRWKWVDLTGQEGAARRTKREFIQFLYIASGSASEIDTQLELAYRLGYLPDEKKTNLDSELEVISKMLSSLIRSQR